MIEKYNSRLRVDLEHHEKMKELYFQIFNRLPDRCVKRKAYAQHRFNFHRNRIEEITILLLHKQGA